MQTHGAAGFFLDILAYYTIYHSNRSKDYMGKDIF